METEKYKLNQEQKFWKAAASLIRSLRPVLFYLLFPACVAGIGMMISGRIHNSQRFIEQSGRFYKTVGLLSVFALMEYRARKRGSSIAGETTLNLEQPDYQKLALLFGTGLGISLFLSAFFTLLPDVMTAGYCQESGAAFVGTDLWLAVFSALILAPVLEEIIFRGYMLNRLLEGFEEKSTLILSGILFGLCHTSPLWVMYASCIGVFLSYIAIKEDNILYSAGLHMGFNFLSVPTLFLMRNPLQYQQIFGNTLVTFCYGMIGGMLSYYLWKLYLKREMQ